MTIAYSAILVGVQIKTIQIETVIGQGFSGFNLLGLPAETTRDMRERVRTALEALGFFIPTKRVVVNIGPIEDIKLSRTPLSHLDFAVAASIIRALCLEKKEPIHIPQKEFFAGELSLQGNLKQLSNLLVYQAVFQNEPNLSAMCLPSPCKLQDERIETFENLKEWLDTRKTKSHKATIMKYDIKSHQRSEQESKKTPPNEITLKEAEKTLKTLLKKPKIAVSLLVAAVGKHNLILAGEPGIGKSYAFKNYPNLLAPLCAKKNSEVQLIHAEENDCKPPFRNPHHSCTSAALIGGASLKPGEATLAHHGVLFLDELAEFPRQSLEALREPLDSGIIVLSRAQGNILYPAKFQFCATTNPCPCGYLFSRMKACRCNPSSSRKYLEKLSGPLMDRFCMQVWIENTEEEKEIDIFGLALKETIVKGKILDFLNLLFQLQLHEDWPYEVPNLHLEYKKLSTRGCEKIKQITHTFANLFPELIKHDSFLDTIVSYRELGQKFLEAHV